ncbi:ExeM/NucH family extracellular endonuclease [Microbacterium sp. P05]|uniref:ExeM/NucH family extracellular endonuclease n=1 Tax=Microbacterium sp. P05 TaxID=3366948 RepID=UPI0037476C17
MTSHPPTTDRIESTRGGRGRAAAASALVAALALGSFAAALPAQAAVSPTAAVVINEVYGGGGNSGAAFKNDFVELTNVSDAAVSLQGWSLQYASASGTSWNNKLDLTGLIAADGTLLVSLSGGSVGADLPTPDLTGGINMSGANGKIALVNSTTQLTGSGNPMTEPTVVDFVGYGSADVFAGAGAAPAPSNGTSVSRNAAHTNTANNGADFAAGVPTPTNSGAGEEPDPDPTDPPAEPTVAAIDEIQGTTDTSPLAGQTVTTEGVVTARYPTGGLNGYIIQTAGSGGALDWASHTASDAVFVYSPAGVNAVALGDTVRVTGAVSEFNGTTQITAAANGATVIADAPAVVPAAVAWPRESDRREALESMLVQPQGDYTVSNTYSTGNYGEIGLATGTEPLRQPTDVARPGTPEAAAVTADNAARAIVLDDASTTNFDTAAGSALTPPYISLTEPISVGGSVTFDEPVVVAWSFGAWKFNPTEHLVGDGTGANDGVTFTTPRTPAPAPVGGDVSVASFNVLNYFTTLGTDTSTCTAYESRDGTERNNVSGGCDQRGAWDAEDFDRQQTKIVEAINALDASVVGLMEIENSAALGETTDEAVASLVAALNADAGSDVWDFIPSSSELPAASTRDVITNAIIYQTAAVEPVGASRALGDQSDDNEAFGNAREPIAQVFEPADGGEEFLFVVNHFKSKGSAGPWPGDADTGDLQGASNESRVRQATALTAWVEQIQGDTESVLLVGDFNSYGQEDPMQVFYGAGYEDAEAVLELDESSYSFSGLSGSLDHILMNEAARERNTGGDIWNINSGEALALEYSRYNYFATSFHEDSPYRSSDHDPIKVGLAADPNAPVELTLLGINDFHGRITGVTPAVPAVPASGTTPAVPAKAEVPGTVGFAGTIEEQRAQAEGPTLFVSSGDNIGASLPVSSLAGDIPTIDVLNALELQTTAVGNHEFDQGFADLTGRVQDAADFSHLGANVYQKGTKTPALQEYEVLDADGLTVAFIGAVTEETPSLVSGTGIATLDFGDPVEAVNRVSAQLSDGIETNGEADVIVALYHEGAGAGTPDQATLEQEVAAGGAFADIVTGTAPEVDAIFNGHTHKQYAWSAEIPGTDRTRPVVQTGSYGENIGKITLSVDPETGEVLAHTQENIPQTKTPAADLIADYPRVAEVDEIVRAAIAEFAEVANEPVAQVGSDITTAFGGGSFIDGVWTGGTRDNRAAESSLGNLVAESIRSNLAELPDGAQIGVTNSGGLRADLYDTQAEFGSTAVAGVPDGTITWGQAYAVLPFNNTMALITLTGAEFTDVLEQQWQRSPDGTVPSRPYLQLGLSDNVTYTFDETRPEGDRITSVTVDGVALDPAAEYRVGTLSFLATGSGDNFRAFAQGSDYVDTGLLDHVAWIDYLSTMSATAPVEPSFEKHAVSVQGAPETVAPGAEVSLTVSNLNMTSLGSPEVTEITATLGGRELDSFPVVGGSAEVTVTVPADQQDGSASLVLTTDVAGTEVTVPLSVLASVSPGTGNPGAEAPNGSWATVTVNPQPVEQGGTLTVTVTGLEPGQQIGATLFSDPIVATGIPAADASGRTSFLMAIPADFALGAHELVVTAEGELPIRVDVTVVANGMLAVTGSELPLGMALAAGMLLVAGGLIYATRRRSPLAR